MGRKKATGLPTMPMVINVVRAPTETAKKKANGYNTLRTVTKKVKPVSEMGYMKATISPTMRMVTGDMKATMANTKGILMMAKSKVNGSYMMKMENLIQAIEKAQAPVPVAYGGRIDKALGGRSRDIG